MRQVEDHHAREKVAPKESLIGEFFVGIKEENLLSIFPPKIKGWHVDDRFGVFAEKTTW